MVQRSELLGMTPFPARVLKHLQSNEAAVVEPKFFQGRICNRTWGRSTANHFKDAPLDFCLERKSPFSFACQGVRPLLHRQGHHGRPPRGPGHVQGVGNSDDGVPRPLYRQRGTTLRFGTDGRCVFVTWRPGARSISGGPSSAVSIPWGGWSADDAGMSGLPSFRLNPVAARRPAAQERLIASPNRQGVGPYIEWSRRYGQLYWRMLGLLDRPRGVKARSKPPAVELVEHEPARSRPR